MRIYKVLAFIVSVFFLLGILSYFYPKDGISIGEVTLRFPSLARVLGAEEEEIPAIDPEKIIAQYQEEEKKVDSLMHQDHDTIAYYSRAMALPTHFYYPEDDSTFFDTFFEKADSDETKRNVTRILYYGDSQIELDRFSSSLRSFFQGNFGGGGAGLLPLVQSVPTATVSQQFTGNYSTYSMYGDGSRAAEGNVGLMAKMFAINGESTFSASASKAMRNNYFNKVSILLSTDSLPLTASLHDRESDTLIALNSDSSGLQLLSWRLPMSTHKIAVNMKGNANIFGVFLDQRAGIAVDNIAMRGVSGNFFTQLNDSLLQIMYQKLNVSMLILQFGGNAMPYIKSVESAKGYVRSMTSQIRFLRRHFPTIPILLIGPADMATKTDGYLHTYPFLEELVEIMKKEIPKAGAAFWDMYAVMGGRNSMIQWVNKGWAASDYIHFSQRGAEEIATVLTNTFATSLNYYRYRLAHPQQKKDSVQQNMDTISFKKLEKSNF